MLAGLVRVADFCGCGYADDDFSVAVAVAIAGPVAVAALVVAGGCFLLP